MYDPLPNSIAVLSFLNLLYIKESLVCYKLNFFKIMQLINKNTLILFVLLTNNNIIYTLTNLNGRVLKSISMGSKKVKGAKKITNTTIFTVIKSLCVHMKLYNFPFLYLRIKGSNRTKNELVKYFKIQGFNILMIQEKLLVPYGGCKNSKSRKL